MRKTGIPESVRELLPLSPAVFYILFALAEGKKHGYAIMKGAETVSGGQFTMGPGTLYTTIQRLLELGLIEETSTPSDQVGPSCVSRPAGRRATTSSAPARPTA